MNYMDKLHKKEAKEVKEKLKIQKKEIIENHGENFYDNLKKMTTEINKGIRKFTEETKTK